MAEDTGAAEAQGAEAGQAQGADSTAQGAPSQSAEAAGDEGGSDVAALTSKVQELEKDNRAYRQREREREAAEKAKATKDLPELERLKAENEELKKANTSLTEQQQEQSLKLAATEVATSLGFRNPAIAYRLIDQSKVDYDDEGAPTNLEPLLKDLAKANEYLLAATDFGGGQRGETAAQGSDDMNTILRRAAGKR